MGITHALVVTGTLGVGVPDWAESAILTGDSKLWEVVDHCTKDFTRE